MDPRIKKAIETAVQNESLARTFKIELKQLETGRSVVEMVYDPGSMSNMFQRAHGGAVYALIDEAFETASQTHGTIAVALNVNVTYVASPPDGARLHAEAREVSRTKKTAVYEINVFGPDRQRIATCQALAYRTGKPLPFI